MKKKTWFIGVPIIVAFLVGWWIFAGHDKDGKSKDDHAVEQVSRSSSSAVKNSDSSESGSTSESSSATANTPAQTISLDEAQQLIQKVGGEWPSDHQKIISQSGNTTVIGGGVGAKGYDKITFTVSGNQVAIHEEFGTLYGGSYQVLSNMPAKDYTTSR
ncbi:hypothetical protein OZX65_06640 [Leuconostocaceae bacterium ESL0723]|nr:hypothetical protein OZX65_06640 [Leuconostocaceae bacterium ESL0723]